MQYKILFYTLNVFVNTHPSQPSSRNNNACHSYPVLFLFVNLFFVILFYNYLSYHLQFLSLFIHKVLICLLIIRNYNIERGPLQQSKKTTNLGFWLNLRGGGVRRGSECPTPLTGFLLNWSKYSRTSNKAIKIYSNYDPPC